MKLAFILNGQSVVMEADPLCRLSSLLREGQGLRGTKVGCRQGQCGVCTVNIEGRACYSCTVFAFQVEGKVVETIEALNQEAGRELHPMQSAFLESGAIQCGYCLPGVLMTVRELLAHNLDPDDVEIREYLAGVRCRWGCYEKFIQSVRGLTSTPPGEKGSAGRG